LAIKLPCSRLEEIFISAARFHLASPLCWNFSTQIGAEVRYIQRRAAEHDERVVSFGQLVLFSTETGDVWLLDASEHLAARLARDGDPESIQIEDTDRELVRK
jgi:hypothetical protein